MSSSTITIRGRRFPRKTFIVSTVAAALVVLTAGTALALYLLQAKVEGQITAAAASLGWSSGSATGTDATCASTKNGTNGSLTINVTNAYPGAECVVNGVLSASGSSEDIVVTKASLVLPTGWTATLTTGACAVVPKSGTATPVVIKVKHDGTTPLAGGAITGGLDAVPASQKAAAGC